MCPRGQDWVSGVSLWSCCATVTRSAERHRWTECPQRAAPAASGWGGGPQHVGVPVQSRRRELLPASPPPKRAAQFCSLSKLCGTWEQYIKTGRFSSRLRLSASFLLRLTPWWWEGWKLDFYPRRIFLSLCWTGGLAFGLNWDCSSNHLKFCS